MEVERGGVLAEYERHAAKSSATGRKERGQALARYHEFLEGAVEE